MGILLNLYKCTLNESIAEKINTNIFRGTLTKI